MENKTCILCGKELEKLEEDFCKSCLEVMKAKYPITKLREEKLRWHKRHSKRQKR